MTFLKEKTFLNGAITVIEALPTASDTKYAFSAHITGSEGITYWGKSEAEVLHAVIEKQGDRVLKKIFDDEFSLRQEGIRITF